MEDFQDELEQDKAGAWVITWVVVAFFAWAVAVVWLCV